MESPESKLPYLDEMGPGKWFNRESFLGQNPDFFPGFRLVTAEDLKPNAKLQMVVIHTDYLDKPRESFKAAEPIQLDNEPIRVIWREDAAPNERYEDKPKGINIIYGNGTQETILLDYFLGKTCKVSLIGNLARIYLTPI